MAIEKQQIKQFTTVLFGDYSAKRYGDTVVVKGKDGSVQTMEIEEFKKFLAENVPNLESKPEQDTFAKAKETFSDIVFPKYEEINENDNLFEKMRKFGHNIHAANANPFQFRGF